MRNSIDFIFVPYFTDIAKKLLISAGTVHVRVKKMEEAGIIKGSSLNLDYVKLGYSFIAYIGIFLEKMMNGQNWNRKKNLMIYWEDPSSMASTIVSLS